MASAKLRRKAHHNEEKFLSPERSRTIKPADFKNHKQVMECGILKLLLFSEIISKIPLYSKFIELERN